jgi:hypothetical protein
MQKVVELRRMKDPKGSQLQRETPHAYYYYTRFRRQEREMTAKVFLSFLVLGCLPSEPKSSLADCNVPATW